MKKLLNTADTFVRDTMEGIEAAYGDQVGLLDQEDRLVLILQEPATAGSVALALTGLYPVEKQSYDGSAPVPSCGPYRICEAAAGELLLEPNPHWTGTKAEFETVRCVSGS